MKKLIVILIIAVALIHASCSGPGAERGDTIIVAGKIEGLDQGTIAVRRDGVLATAEINPDGTFYLPFSYYAKYYFQFRLPNESFWMYLDLGDSIHITADINDFRKTFRASGDKAVEAEFMVRKEALDNPMALMSADLDEYFLKKEGVQAPLIGLVSDLENQPGVDADFLRLEKAYIELQSLDLDWNYPLRYRMRMGMGLDDPIDFPEEETNIRMASLDYDDPLMLRFGIFRNFANRRLHEFRQKMMEGINVSEIGVDSSMIITVMAADSLFIPEVRDFLLFEMLQMNIGFAGPENFRRASEVFISLNENPYYRTKIEEAIGQWDAVSPGSLVPDFAFSDINGNVVSLGDLSGKLVYIDVWATWCGPCLAEHPNWDKLVEEYSDRGIAFLTISIDESPEPWMKMVREKNMKGHNWYAKNAWQSELAVHFNIRGIPRFILLDRQRRVIDASAARPSGNIRELIDSHI